MALDVSRALSALVTVANLESQVALLPRDVAEPLQEAVLVARRTVEKLFREEAGFYIGDNVVRAAGNCRVDAIVVKDGLVVIEMSKLKKDGKPGRNRLWDYFSAGFRKA